jgi:DNA polymerase-3 subunit delta'
MRLAYGRKIIELNGWVDEVAGIGRERQKQLLDYGLRLLRENFMMHMSPEELTFMSRKEADFSGKFYPFIHGNNVYGLVEEFGLAGNHIAANGNPKIIFMDLAIKVIRLLMQKAPGAA